MNISEDKIFSDVMQSARDSSNAMQIATQSLNKFDKFENKFDEFDKRLQKNIADQIIGVKESIFQDRDRYFEKKDKPVLEAIEKISEKLDELNTWKVAADGDIKKAKWGLRVVFTSILGYFGVNVKGL